MDGHRCTSCDHVTWSFLPIAHWAGASCPLCGGRTVVERRHPGRDRRRHPVPSRRDRRIDSDRRDTGGAVIA